MTDVSTHPITTLLSQLTYSPLYILIVILSIVVLMPSSLDQYYSTVIYKCIAVFYIFIYLLAVYFYISAR